MNVIGLQTLMELLCPKAVMQRFTKTERWRAVGMVQNGGVLLNVASLKRHSVSSADYGTAISRLEM